MQSGSSLTPNNPAFSVSIGIAALVLEGRPLFDDEYTADEERGRPVFFRRSTSSSDNRHIPWPGSAYQTRLAKQDSIQHLHRLRQKLHQLRSTPSTSRDGSEQMLAVELGSPTTTMCDSDEELEMIYKIQAATAASLENKPTLAQKPPTLNTLQILAASSVQTTPRSVHKHTGLLKTVESFFTEKFNTPSTSGSSSSSSASTPSSSTSTPVLNNFQIAKLKAKAKLVTSDKGQTKVLGPHCELFLKKIGLGKGSGLPEQNHDFDEHFCDSARENCFRWQLHYRQLVSVFARGDPICIEVYLGPENHVILLEQWIIQQTNETCRIPMTLQSLCTAIRSQLYFSQITAWTDLLKFSSPLDTEIKNNPRIKNGSKIGYKPKLDILYRIRPYDSTSCFNAKPTEHNFPETMVTENLSVKVSLRSLPRMKSIPQLQYVAKIPVHSFDVGCESLEAMLLHDRMSFACHEKGKHRCTFEEELANEDMDSVSPSITLSHRDKQLNKYKKRLLRRDKKKRSEEIAPVDSSAIAEPASDSNSDEMTGSIVDPSIPMAATNSQYDHTINSIRPPLYSSLSSSSSNDKPATAASTTSKSTQTSTIVMTSVATQTDNAALCFPNCDFCGVEMQYFCWNCDKKMFADSTETQRILDKADLLLQAIKRTPVAKQMTQNHTHTDANDASVEVGSSSDDSTCDNDRGVKRIELSNLCCKRQKTVHNYFSDIAFCHSNNNNNNNNNTNYNNNLSHNNNNEETPRCSLATKTGNRSYDDDRSVILAMKKELCMGESSGSYRRTLSESVVGTCISGDAVHNSLDYELATSNSSMNVISNDELKLFRRAYSEDELICNCEDNRPKQADLLHTCDTKYPPKQEYRPLTSRLSPSADKQFTTPTSSQMVRSPTNYKINPLYITCRDDECSSDTFPAAATTSKLSNKAWKIPKVNLTKLFSGQDSSKSDAFAINNDLDVETELEHIAKISLPMSLNSVFNFDNLSPPLPSPTGAFVQKSNSAPTLPYSPALSPRFVKSAAAYKRRSRHLSDRSSIGSDEHFSDEEFHQYASDKDNGYRPGISPSKAALKLFPKNYGFRRRALLGSFEESLLQRRLEPKFLVPGYKVLLGASGCYCTTQITIPAYTFFYELNAETMSTPYVCEISMPPRKGYVVPRTGHVQATLLNPLGMVVRMFVVAYDFRDMPSMSQTFVRQRILSFDENANPGQSVDDLSASEQMKLLRYAIHLRFQTTRSGRLALHTDIRMLISRRTDCDTAAAHAKGALESPSELKTVTIVPENPKFSPR